MDSIKEAFQKVKQDIDSLNFQLKNIKEDLHETRSEMLKIIEILKEMSEKSFKTVSQGPLLPPAQEIRIQTTSTHIPAHDWALEGLKPQNLGISTGNEGVPADRQTDRQTDKTPQNRSPNAIDNAAEILDSLDGLKKEIRIKFKQLTDQEVLVFSALYQLEEEQGPVDYKTLSVKLGLTESSIRDYIGRLLKKGIPLDKKRINNKQILISISPNLKKIATLPTILKLREL